MNLLHLDASVLGDQSVSRQVTAAIVARLVEAHPDLAVTHRDLGAEPPPPWAGPATTRRRTRSKPTARRWTSS